MLSPLELENKRILTNKRKYDKFEIDEYIDMVFENYKALFNENEELKKQIKTLSEGIQYYRSIESTMQKALVLAEKTSKETKDAAALKAESIEKDARNRADQIVGTAEAEYTRIREKCIALVQQFNQYKAQLQIAANEQLRLITSATFEVETPEIDNQSVSEPINAGTGMHAVSAEEPSGIPVQDNSFDYGQPIHGLDLQSQTQVSDGGFDPSQPVRGIDLSASTPASVYEERFDPSQSVNGFDLQAPTPTSDGGFVSTDQSDSVADSSVYSFSSMGSDTKPLPNISGIEPDTTSFAPTPPPKQEPAVGSGESLPDPMSSNPVQPQTGISQAQMRVKQSQEAKASSASNSIAGQEQVWTADSPDQNASNDVTLGFSFDNGSDTVPDKTMVLPDVKSVDREALRGKKPELTTEMLVAQTINLEDSIREVRNHEQEPLQVPTREEQPQILQMEPEPAAVQSQAQGLDTILQNITIGKKKKNANGGDSQEDPFEFLGSVDDF